MDLVHKARPSGSLTKFSLYIFDHHYYNYNFLEEKIVDLKYRNAEFRTVQMNIVSNRLQEEINGCN